MWRAMGALVLTLAALAWGVVSIAVCFFYLSAFWRDTFGRAGAFYVAIVAFIVCLVGARLILRLADYLLDPYSGPFDPSVYAGSPRDDVHRDWRRYAGDIIRSRRYAFYARTGRWDKLAALELEQAAAELPAPGPAGSVVTADEASRPSSRTSMAGQLGVDEVRRGSRRITETAARTAPPADRWRWIDDEE